MYVETNAARPTALAAPMLITAVKLLKPVAIQRSAVTKSHLVVETLVRKTENVAMKKQWLVVVKDTAVPHPVPHSLMLYHAMK